MKKTALGGSRHLFGGRRRVLLLGVLAVLLSGCLGFTTPATDVTSTSALLHTSVECGGTNPSNPCQGFYEYWADGGPVNTSKLIVPTQNGPFNTDVPLPVSGLDSGALYHYQFCGKGDDKTQFTCTGPNWADGTSNPACTPTPSPTTCAGISLPLDNTSNFRTANPNSTGPNPHTNSTVDYGRVTSSGETNNKVLYSRDTGISAQFSTNPSESLWLFGDTKVIPQPGSTSQGGWIQGSTAAIATNTPGKPGVSLTEVPSPAVGDPTNPTAPKKTVAQIDGVQPISGASQFLGNPVPMPNCNPNILNPNSNNPQLSDGITSAIPARWPTSIAVIPGSSNVVIFYTDVCVTNTITLGENHGIVVYNPVTNEFPFGLGVNLFSTNQDSTLSLTAPLTAGTTYNSLPVAALAAGIPAGSHVFLQTQDTTSSGCSATQPCFVNQQVELSQAANPGATAIQVLPFKAQNSYPTGTVISPPKIPPREDFLGATFSSDGDLYLYSQDSVPTPGVLPNSPVYLARISVSNWSSASAYQWCVLSNGSCAWTSSSMSASPVTSSLFAGSTSFSDFSSQPSVCAAAATNCYVILNQLGGFLNVLTAVHPWGPWTVGPSAFVPDSCNVQGSIGCYQIEAKPELSNSSQLTYSWMSQDDDHMRLGTMNWTTPLT